MEACMNKKYLVKVLESISADLRKIGITLVGVGVAGILIGGDVVSATDGACVASAGVFFYTVGIILIEGD
jgi:hypothetical protein